MARTQPALMLLWHLQRVDADGPCALVSTSREEGDMVGLLGLLQDQGGGEPTMEVAWVESSGFPNGG